MSDPGSVVKDLEEWLIVVVYMINDKARVKFIIRTCIAQIDLHQQKHFVLVF